MQTWRSPRPLPSRPMRCAWRGLSVVVAGMVGLFAVACGGGSSSSSGTTTTTVNPELFRGFVDSVSEPYAAATRARDDCHSRSDVLLGTGTCLEANVLPRMSELRLATEALRNQVLKITGKNTFAYVDLNQLEVEISRGAEDLRGITSCENSNASHNSSEVTCGIFMIRFGDDVEKLGAMYPPW